MAQNWVLCGQILPWTSLGKAWSGLVLERNDQHFNFQTQGVPAACDWASALWLQQHSESAFFGTPCILQNSLMLYVGNDFLTTSSPHIWLFFLWNLIDRVYLDSKHSWFDWVWLQSLLLSESFLWKRRAIFSGLTSLSGIWFSLKSTFLRYFSRSEPRLTDLFYIW